MCITLDVPLFAGDLPVCAPPLPISNREVKACRTDDSRNGESRIRRHIKIHQVHMMVYINENR